MKNILIAILMALAVPAVFLNSTSAFAQTNVQSLALEAPDGNRITGFIYQNITTRKNAPLAILMHGMTGSSLDWLADNHRYYTDLITKDLIRKGYRVVALDARSHGMRKDEMKPHMRLKNLRSGKPEPYLAMIEGTLNDYDVLLEKVNKKYGPPKYILAAGYSMGAQMVVLFAAKHKEVTHIVTMVPPAAQSAKVVAPVNHASKVQAQWLLITASKDQFSSKADNDALAKAGGEKVARIEFDSKHILPRGYVDAVIEWIAKIGSFPP